MTYTLIFVTLLLHNLLMICTKKLFALTLAVQLCVFRPSFALADIYIDLSQDDEISISNNEQGSTFAIKIEEPAAQLQPTMTAIFNGASRINAGTQTNKNQLPYHDEVLLAAKATALSPALIHAIIATESKHNAHAKSHKGAVGLMQLMPATASRFKVKNKHDPQQNILAGSQYLRELLVQFNGDLKLSLAAYNAGPGAVIKYHHKIPPYKETRDYVPRVLKYYRQYS